MSKILQKAILPLAMVGSVATGAEPVLNCWDGTFFYNVMSIKSDEQGYEVGFTGSFKVNTLKLRSHSGPFLPPQHALGMIKFPHEACKMVRDDEGAFDSLTCERGEGQESKPNLFFVQHGVSDIDEPIDAISPFEIDSASLSADRRGAILRFKQKFDSDPQQVLSVSDTPYCTFDGSVRTGGTRWGGADFPERLRNFIRVNDSF